jgi:gliding motility-associated-like protein
MPNTTYLKKTIAIDYSPNTIYRATLLCSLLFAIINNAFSQAPNITYLTPQTYTVGTSISPLSPVNTGGAVVANTYGSVNTFATGFNTPTSTAVDAAGYVYVCDWGGNQIKKVNPVTGSISVFAGSGAQGAANGTGTTASFYLPDGIVLDAAGNSYVSDMGNNLIRKITPAGVVTTLAGSGLSGASDGVGAAASFSTPRGLAIDPAGNVYVADQGNNLIRKISPAGVVTTIGGTNLNTPTAVGIDAAGNLYISDSGNGVIKKVTSSGVVSTLATGLNFPREIRVDNAGNCYVTEQSGNLIKKISPTGVVTIIANSGLNGPIGLTLDGLGNLYIADIGSNSIKRLIVAGYTIDKPLPAGLTFDTVTGIISGTPTTTSPATNYTVTAYNSSGSSSTVINIKVAAAVVLLPSVITFPKTDLFKLSGLDLPLISSSTNTQTPVIYTTADPKIATINPDGTSLHITGPGSVLITATQAGNNNYTAANPISQTLTVIINQAIDFAVIPKKNTCSTDFLVPAADNNDLNLPLSLIPITYLSSNPAVATISAQGIIHILSAGTTIITASQGGNALYNAAVPKSQTLTVAASIKPDISINTGTVTSCVGLPVTYSVTVLNLSALTNPGYQWQVNGNNVGTGSLTYTSTTLTSADLVTCIVTNNDICPNTTIATAPPVQINAYTPLTVNIQSSASVAVCSGTTVTFTATPNTSGVNVIYQWSLNGTNVGTNSTTYTNNNFLNDDIVTCTYTNNDALCLISKTVTSSPQTVAITVPPGVAPSVAITASAASVYAGLPITFIATPLNAGKSVAYQWQVNGTDAGTNNNTLTSATLTNGDKITCILTPGISCAVPTTSLPIIVTILPPLSITPPNTFTPNGDGVNDSWEITGLNTYTNCLATAYNRYGVMVFQSKGYSKPWDGLYNGKSLPAGTYYYIIDLNNTMPKLSGYVTIIR